MTKTQIKTPLRQEKVKNTTHYNVMCTVCSKVFSNHQAALDHAWSIENPKDCEEYNYCSHQQFQAVQWFETQMCQDIDEHDRKRAYEQMGRTPHFNTYEPILNSDGIVAVEPKTSVQIKGFNWVHTNYEARTVANENPKMGLIYSKDY